MKSVKPNLLQGMIAALALTLSTTVMAAYPEKTIRIVVPFPPGGPSDVAARAVSQGLATELKQSVVVENMPGASGAIAAQAVLRAPADGYTLLWVPTSLGVVPHIQNKPAFKSLNDFTPVSSIVSFSFGLFVHPSVPAQTVAELIAYAKANPGKLSYASGAPSEHIVTAQFLHQTKVDMLRVPYKGGSQAMPDLLAGRVQVFFTPLPLGLPHAKSGKLRLLASLTPTRTALSPNVPTLEELGIKGIFTPTTQGLAAPPQLPAAIAVQLANAVAKVTEQQSMKELFAEQGSRMNVHSLQAYDKQLRDENELWKRFVIENDIPKE